MAVSVRSFLLALGGAALAAVVALGSMPISDRVQALAYGRPGSRSCVPPSERGNGPAALARELTAGELEAFRRDGVLIVRGALSEEWIGRLQALVEDVFTHPTLWDVIYSRMVANFYCAQKSILLHHTSQCGREIAEAAPTTALAAQLLGSSTLRVCEPTEALGNFRAIGAECGHTAWHRDDKYFPVERVDPASASVVRLWIPVADFGPAHFRFQALNNSLEKQAQRAARGLAIQGTDFAFHERLEASGVLDGHVVDGGAAGLHRGDIVAFAGETPHYAQMLNCSGADARGCLRVILSFAGDNAQYVRGRWTSLLPVHGNQSVGSAPQGRQFPRVFPGFDEGSWEWSPFRPSYNEMLTSLIYASVAGFKSFWRFDRERSLAYIHRVSTFAQENIWDVPLPDQAGSSTLDLAAYFSGAGAAAAATPP